MAEYYTPDIEEFYVGFTFELSIVYPPINTWVAGRIDSVEAMVELPALLQNKEIRVKYLDGDDLEELGWQYKKQENEITLYEKTYENGLVTANLITADKHKVIIVVKYATSQIPKFTGTIKSKGELKLLLSWLNL